MTRVIFFISLGFIFTGCLKDITTLSKNQKHFRSSQNLLCPTHIVHENNNTHKPQPDVVVNRMTHILVYNDTFLIDNNLTVKPFPLLDCKPILQQ